MKDEEIESLFNEVEQGDHISSICKNVDEEYSVLSKFLEKGLEKGNKCYYIHENGSRGGIIGDLKKYSNTIEEYLNSGAVEILKKSESYLKSGIFDFQQIFDTFDRLQREALDDGYEGVWVAGQMSWFMSDSLQVRQFMKYESKFNEYIEDQNLVALCFYDESSFPLEILFDVIHTHPKVILNGSLHENRYFMPIEIFAPMVTGDVDRERYEKIKKEIERNSSFSESSSDVDEYEELHSLLETAQKLERVSR